MTRLVKTPSRRKNGVVRTRHTWTNRQFFGQGLSALGPILGNLSVAVRISFPFLGIIFIGILAARTCWRGHFGGKSSRSVTSCANQRPLDFSSNFNSFRRLSSNIELETCKNHFERVQRWPFFRLNYAAAWRRWRSSGQSASSC